MWTLANSTARSSARVGRAQAQAALAVAVRPRLGERERVGHGGDGGRLTEQERRALARLRRVTASVGAGRRDRRTARPAGVHTAATLAGVLVLVAHERRCRRGHSVPLGRGNAGCFIPLAARRLDQDERQEGVGLRGVGHRGAVGERVRRLPRPDRRVDRAARRQAGRRRSGAGASAGPAKTNSALPARARAMSRPLPTMVSTLCPGNE